MIFGTEYGKKLKAKESRDTVNAGCITMAVIWIFSILASLSLFAGIIYVAWHFISKFW